MKKKILSILATLLLCLALQSVTALAVDDPEGSSFGVTVNETQVTVSNQNDVLGNGWVSYDPDTNVLSVNGSQGSNLTISGSGSTDVVINGSLTSNSPVVGKLTIDGANNVTLTASCSSPAISSDANITCTGDVTISNETGFCTGSSLTVMSANDVTVTASYSNGPAISGFANITCTGDVNISNSSGFCVGGALTINGANDVTVTASYSNGPAINSTANITCTGDVTISNETGFCTDSSLTVESAKDVTVTAKNNGPAIRGLANITCTGDVNISNSSGFCVGGPLTINGANDVTVTASYSNGPAINSTANITCTGDVTISNETGFCTGSSLTVKSAKDVTVTTKYDGPAIVGDFNNEIGADISCSGDIRLTNDSGFVVGNKLTIGSAGNVTITGNSSGAPLLTQTVDITCTGNVEISNTNGMAVGNKLKYNNVSDHRYVVKTGASPDSLAVYQEKNAGETFGPEILGYTVRSLKIETIHIYGEWEHDNAQHWKSCTLCDDKFDKADHTFNGNTCTECGYTRSSNIHAYPPVIKDAINGSVEVSPKNPSRGSTVTIVPKPDEGYEVDSVTVIDKDGAPVAVTDNGDGTYSFTQPAGKVTVKVTFTEKTNIFFEDVPSGAYYYDAVMWAVENGITTGTGDTTFSPDAPCSRAQTVAFLWRAAGCPVPMSGEMLFTDVDKDSYYETAVMWALENGITKGTGDTTFSPDAACSRGQIVTFLCRAFGKETGSETPFTDVAADAYYAPSVSWAAANGVTGGTGDGYFSPDADCTRAQIVTFLYRCLGDK